MKKKKFEIIPALMPKDFDSIQETVSLVRGLVDTVQLDVMDGKFVPNISWPFWGRGGIEKGSVEKVFLEGFPFWEEMDYEFDLMVKDAEKFLDIWIQCSPSRTVFHYASISDWNEIFYVIEKFSPSIEFGLAVTVLDPIEKILHSSLFDHFSYIQVMGIRRIGFMGQEFTDEVFSLIEKIKINYPEKIISIDGGVSRKNIVKLAQAGVTRFVSGSGIFQYGDPRENIEEYFRILENTETVDNSP